MPQANVSSPPQPILRGDYVAPDYRTAAVDVTFEIGDGSTRVTNRLDVVRQGTGTELVLDGQMLELESVAVDGRRLSGNEFQLDSERLTLFDLPERAAVEIVTRIEPEKNTALEGLYRSRSMYCTQCEAEGFRRITYYQDRPDVLARFRTTIVADGERCPDLLSNGNLVEESTMPDGRKRAVWEDPHPKPSYLFALVAGKLDHIVDQFVTSSGRKVELRIYSEPHNIGHCSYAMDSLKRAMRWDEEVFGREYDLDIFMIVAVEDFNMGAMENKGLNIFNTSCVLASPDNATDAAYQRVEAVVAHEYFHNWSGNRVTCRDWFQLSLKEGFTVFRDAEFSSDMNSRTVKRIEDVSFLRSVQFAEDAGPLAHPIRPDSYIEISNFYTPTVYEKGAEVVRMIHTLLGAERFRRGSDLYFDRHDGAAATTEDFVQAMEDASGVDLGEFRRWYAQAGTPIVRYSATFEGRALELEFAQRCPATPGQPVKRPLHVPLRVGLVRADGGDVALDTLKITGDAEVELRGTDVLVHLKSETASVRFDDLSGAVIPSVLRGFSAPVRLEAALADSDLEFLAQHDSDGFCRWDALQTRWVREVERLMNGGTVSPGLLSLADALVQQALALIEEGAQRLYYDVLLAPPGVGYLLEQFDVVDTDVLCDAVDELARVVAGHSAGTWREVYDANEVTEPYEPSAEQMGRRALRNRALRALAWADVEGFAGVAERQYRRADNLTDRRAALAELVEVGNDGAVETLRSTLLTEFYDRWQQEALAVNTWLSLQAVAGRPGGLERVRKLAGHAAFDARNPNKVRALYGAFAQMNFRNFHNRDGSGYAFLAEKVLELDAANPQLAARLANPLTRWRKYDPARQRLMKEALGTMTGRAGLSKDLFEVVGKSLAEGEPTGG